MATYTITLSDAEDKALGVAAVSQQEWINNAVHERCRISMDEICQITVTNCLEQGIQIPGSKDEMVALAFAQGWVNTAAERQAEAEAAAVTRAAEQAAAEQGA